MLLELERIAGRIANTPKPPLPGSVVEEVPARDSREMLTRRNGMTHLPGGAVIEYTDEDGAYSVRRVTLRSGRADGPDPSLTAFCHLRGDLRRFRLERIGRVLDPHGSAQAYASPMDFLARFHVEAPGNADEVPLRGLLRALRHELTVLMFFSRCDGYLHPAERAVMMDYIAQAYGDAIAEPDTVWEVVRRLYPDSDAMLVSARALAEHHGSETLADLRRTIRRLIEADGVIHTDEALHAIELAYLDD
jgi:hypothetical protein